MMTEKEDTEMTSTDEKNLMQLFLEFEEHEKYTTKFNIFDYIDIAGNELKHSDILIWLLNPLNTHGLGDSFLKSFLKNIIKRKFQSEKLWTWGIAANNLSNIEISVNNGHSDISIKNNEESLIICVAGKQSCFEHLNLVLSLSFMQKHYKEYKSIIKSEKPLKRFECKDDDYTKISYSVISQILKNLCSEESIICRVRPFILKFLRDYIEILDKHPVSEQLVIELDLLLELRNPKSKEIAEIIKEIIYEENEFTIDNERSIPLSTYFIAKAVDFEILKKNTRRTVLFKITHVPFKLKFEMVVKTGDKDLQEKIHRLLIKSGIQESYASNDEICFLDQNLVERNDYHDFVNQPREEIKLYLESKLKDIKIKKLSKIIEVLKDAFQEEMSV